MGPVAAVTADAMVDIDGAAPSRLGERWRRIVELWSQTTFYLFDADSWRR